MPIYDVIKNFHKQFEYEPKIENGEKLVNFEKFVAAGMGGSHLAADLIKSCGSRRPFKIHSDYGLPPLAEDFLKNALFVVISYSGNTEETLDAYEKARERNLPIAAISSGGKLLEYALRDGIPHIRLPSGIQPRLAVGFMFKAVLKIMGEEELLERAGALSYHLDPPSYETAGISLAERLRGFVPIVYASAKNQAVALNWKTAFNETAKIPAFGNVFPELNHNEMAGFDVQKSNAKLSQNFYLFFLKDGEDEPRIGKRMELTEKLLREKKLITEIVELEGKNRPEKIFSSLLLAHWTSYYLAQYYGVEPEEVQMVEKFKSLLDNG